MTIPTLIGIPVGVYFDRSRVVALLGEPEAIDSTESEPGVVVRNYAWQKGCIGIATYQSANDDEQIIGVRSSAGGGATDRGLGVGSSLRRARVLYGGLQLDSEGHALFRYSDGQLLRILMEAEHVVGLQLLSAALAGPA